MEVSRSSLSSALALLSLLAVPVQAGITPADILPSAARHIARPISLAPIPLRDDVSTASAAEGLAVLTSNAEYRAFLGHSAPAAVDWNRQWVAFYSGGLYLSGGFSASIEVVQYNPASQSLLVSTLLLVPAEGCVEPEILSWPHALVTFPRPSGNVDLLRFDRQFALFDCGS